MPRRLPLHYLLALLLLAPMAVARGQGVVATSFDGIVVGGYVDGGAFLNFTGPNINMTRGQLRILVGMLPSLRIKKDSLTPRNSAVTPSLGTGVTVAFRRMAIQLPLYYNAKTGTANGRWRPGIGVGVRLR